MGASTVASYTRLRNCTGEYVGAEKPRITMQTDPLSPCCTTSNPDLVRTLLLARSETFAGAAVLANAVSAPRCIRYCPIGGDFWGFGSTATRETLVCGVY